MLRFTVQSSMYMYSATFVRISMKHLQKFINLKKMNTLMQKLQFEKKGKVKKGYYT